MFNSQTPENPFSVSNYLKNGKQVAEIVVELTISTHKKRIKRVTSKKESKESD
jgi:hypothetical protein